jgi:hypothetical protein
MPRLPFTKKTPPPAAPSRPGRGPNAIVATPEPTPGRFAQIASAFKLTRQRDAKLIPYLVLTFVVVLGVMALIGVLTGSLIVFLISGLVFAVLVTFSVFGRRAQSAAYSDIEGQPGAAAAIVDGMRGDWRLSANVAATRSMDVVHRVVGKPGVVLLAEGDQARLQPLIADQKKRIQRVAAQTEIEVIYVGNEKGEVSLAKLTRKMNGLPRRYKGATVDQIEGRMRALGGLSIPIPKGPMPKGARMPKGVKPPR